MDISLYTVFKLYVLFPFDFIAHLILCVDCWTFSFLVYRSAAKSFASDNRVFFLTTQPPFGPRTHRFAPQLFISRVPLLTPYFTPVALHTWSQASKLSYCPSQRGITHEGQVTIFLLCWAAAIRGRGRARSRRDGRR